MSTVMSRERLLELLRGPPRLDNVPEHLAEHLHGDPDAHRRRHIVLGGRALHRRRDRRRDGRADPRGELLPEHLAHPGAAGRHRLAEDRRERVREVW